MMKLTVNGEEYKIKFGYNSFCDTDLMDRVAALTELFSENNSENDSDVSSIGRIKDLFQIVRELLFVGFKKYNPMESEQAVGDLLDEYIDEDTEEERGLLHLFTDLTEELFNEGFLGDMMNSDQTVGMQNGAKAPMDHQKAQK